MSRIITHSNILVDDFDFCKSFPRNSFVHFLTHFHSDHYEGLSPLWDYGPIHTTHQTRKFLLHKYPKLPRIVSHDYNAPAEVELVEGELKVEVTFFDAKHIPGSAMILFRGHMGSILFTGDFRYEYAMVKENPILFPPRLRNWNDKQEVVESLSGISIRIDEMIFDNTYCNPFFKFEREPAIAAKMIDIIEKNRDKKLVYIAMGALGKHRILMRLGEYFQTAIVVSEKQLKKIELANLRTDFLTTDPQQGFIHLISKKERAGVVERTKRGPLGGSFICIDTDFLMLEHQAPDQINYIVPYSLHSNFPEMATLVRLVQPCILRKIVIPYANFRQTRLRIKIDHRLKFAKYLDFLEREANHSESGYALLVREYTCIHQLSKKFLQWFDPDKQRQLMALFGLGNGEQNHELRKRKPVLLTEEEMSNRSRPMRKKRKLKDIADELHAVNKNTTIEQAIEKQKEKETDSKFREIFSQSHSNSQTHRPHPRPTCDSDYEDTRSNQ